MMKNETLLRASCVRNLSLFLCDRKTCLQKNKANWINVNYVIAFNFYHWHFSLFLLWPPLVVLLSDLNYNSPLEMANWEIQKWQKRTNDDHKNCFFLNKKYIELNRGVRIFVFCFYFYFFILTKWKINVAIWNVNISLRFNSSVEKHTFAFIHPKIIIMKQIHTKIEEISIHKTIVAIFK